MPCSSVFFHGHCSVAWLGLHPFRSQDFQCKLYLRHAMFVARWSLPKGGQAASILTETRVIPHYLGTWFLGDQVHSWISPLLCKTHTFLALFPRPGLPSPRPSTCTGFTCPTSWSHFGARETRLRKHRRAPAHWPCGPHSSIRPSRAPGCSRLALPAASRTETWTNKSTAHVVPRNPQQEARPTSYETE